MRKNDQNESNIDDDKIPPRRAVASSLLRDALQAARFVMAPGCYNSLGARLAERHGFEAVYMSGLAVTASLLARPDLELLGMAEMVRQASLIASAVRIPVIADADTGYGGLANVERTTWSYMQAGVAAIHLEDQVSPKRCGHLAGVRLIEPEQMLAKLQTATEARGDGDMLIIARTDAFKVAGLDEAIRRAKLYAAVRPDVLFIDGVTEPRDFRQVRQSLEGPLMASIVEIDGPAKTSARQLEQMGYSIAIFALSAIQASAGALDRLMAEIKSQGSTDRSFEGMMSYSILNKVLGIEHYHTLWDRLGDSEKTGEHS